MTTATLPARETSLPEERVCIASLNRADIAARDWGAVHTAADRAEPLKIGERRKWGWRG